MISLRLTALFFLVAPVFAQDIVGTWQGTLRDRRIALVVAEGGMATAYNLDQPDPQPLAVADLGVQGGVLKFTLPTAAADYQGRVAADGKSITGTLRQPNGEAPLNFEKATPQTAWTLLAPVPAPVPMAPDAPLQFEVATIKPSDPNSPARSYGFRGGNFLVYGFTLNGLISFAYGVHSQQVAFAANLRGQGWMEEERFDIVAKPVAPGVPNEAQTRTMMQKLLEERFGLRFHRENRELSVFTISPGKGAHKLIKNDSNPTGRPRLVFAGLGRLPGQNATVEDLARALQMTVFDRPVIDRTGITGRWDFSLSWIPDETQFLGLGPQRATLTNNDPNAASDVIAAFREQLGLTFETAKAPVEVLVLDGVTKPTEN